MRTEELKHYISRAQKKGFKLRAVKKYLRKVGHDRKSIKKAVKELKKEAKPAKKRAINIILEILIAILVLEIMAVLMFSSSFGIMWEKDFLHGKITQEVASCELVSFSSQVCMTDSSLKIILYNSGIEINQLDLSTMSEKRIDYMMPDDSSIKSGTSFVMLIEHDKKIYGKLQKISIIPKIIVNGRVEECPQKSLTTDQITQCTV
jgi:hypothetical protein